MWKNFISNDNRLRSAFHDQVSCRNIFFSIFGVCVKIGHYYCARLLAILLNRNLASCKSVFKKKREFVAILLGIEQGSLFQQDFRKFLIGNVIVVNRSEVEVRRQRGQVVKSTVFIIDCYWFKSY